MRLAQDKLAQIKNYVHAGQGATIAVAWLLCIIIFTRDGNSDGRIGWYFGLCWLSIPILVYLVMVPMWSRARRFSNVYAFATLDALSVIFWLSAWAAMASYVVEGKGRGEDEEATGCDNFKFGSPGRCRISEGVIILGVVLMLSFAATAFVSFKAVMHYKRTGEMPTPGMGNENFAKQTQDAFSSNIRTDDPFDDNQTDPETRQANRSGYEAARRSEDDEYALLHNNDHDDLYQAPPPQPADPLGYGSQSGGTMHDYNTSYAGAFDHHSPEHDAGNGLYGR